MKSKSFSESQAKEVNWIVRGFKQLKVHNAVNLALCLTHETLRHKGHVEIIRPRTGDSNL